MLTLCNCATKTRNYFIHAQVLFHSNNFLLNEGNFASDHEMLQPYFIKKRQKVLETGLFANVIRYKRLVITDIDFLSTIHTSIFKLIYVKIVSGTKN